VIRLSNAQSGQGAGKLKNTWFQAPSPLIAASQLSRRYQRGLEEVHAIENATFSIPSGAFVLIVGPSGSDKSTLLNLISGIDRPTSGSLIVRGQNLSDLTEAELDIFRGNRISFVFQFNNLLPNLNAIENVALPLVAQGMRWKAAHAQAFEDLKSLDLSQRAAQRLFERSEGKQERGAPVRVVTTRPAVVLVDKPTSDLDAGSRRALIELIAALNDASGVTFLTASREIELPTRATQSIQLPNGRISSLAGAA
jgi:ABC-type lipoprotein export system ATPase subunit